MLRGVSRHDMLDGHYQYREEVTEWIVKSLPPNTIDTALYKSVQPMNQINSWLAFTPKACSFFV